MKNLKWQIVAASLLSALTATAAGTVQGTLDLVDGTTCGVAGWARDPASTDPLQVQIYRDGPAETGSFVTTGTANVLRSDLPFADQNHGFNFILPPDPGIADGKAHTIFAYGVGTNGVLGMLSLSGKTMTCRALPRFLNTVVTAYGAQGDGITDDSDAIQRAIDDTISGGTVFVPAGTYMLGKAHGPGVTYSPAQVVQGVTGESYALDLRGSITLRGEGRRSILKLMPVRLGILHIRDSVDMLVEKLVLDGNASQRYLRNPTTGVSFDWPLGNIVSGLVLGSSITRGPIFRDCEIRNGLEDGVGTLPGPEFTVESCYIHDNGAYAIDGSGRGGGVGISMNGGLRNRALHNVLVRNTHAIAIGFGPREHTVEDNAFVNNCSGLVVGSGHFNDSDQVGSGFLIADNLIERNGVCGGIGLSVTGKESGTVIDNAVINNQGDAGVVFLPQPNTSNISRNWVLMRNLIGNTAPDRPQRVGIVVEASSHGIALQGNTVMNNGVRIEDQVIVQSPTAVNSDWPSVNTISFTFLGPIPPAPTVASVVHAATQQPGALAPGEVIVIRGERLGPTSPVTGQVTSYGRLQRTVAAVRVLFDGVPAPLQSVSANEIKAVVPYYTYWKDTVHLEVEFQGIRSAPATVALVESSPGIFPGSVANEDGSPNSITNPASKGSLVTFSATGEGQTDPAGVDGRVSADDNLPTPRGAVTVTVGGQSVELANAKATPLAPAGTMRVTIRVPVTATVGTPLPIVLAVGNQQSPQTASAQIFVSNAVFAGSAYSRNYVQKAYVAYYGRPADPGGQSYWALRMDAEGQSLNAIIGAFGYSDEFNRRYGGLSYAALVTKIYQQTLGRDPDPAGLAYYVGELQAGRRSLQSITLDVLNGATTAPDSTVVANKLDVAAYYSAKVAAGCPYGSELDGVNAITGVSSNSASVTGAKLAIDTRCGP